MPSAGRPGWEFVPVSPPAGGAESSSKNPLAAVALSATVAEWSPTSTIVTPSFSGKSYGSAAPRQLQVSLIGVQAGDATANAPQAT